MSRQRPDARQYRMKKPHLMRQRRGRCSYWCRRQIRATVDHIVPYRDSGPPTSLTSGCPANPATKSGTR